MADEAKNQQEEAAAGAEAAAPAEGAPAEGAAPPAAKGISKLYLFGGIGLGVLVVVVGIAMFFLLGNGEKKEEEAHTEVPAIAVLDVPEFTLNLVASDEGAQNFLKAKFAVELANPADAKAVEQYLPRLQDDWGGFLRQMRVDDLQGSAAIQRVKEALLRRANQSLAPLQVKAVYVREMLVQ